MSVINNWGVAAVIAIAAVLPTGFVVAALSGGNTPSADLAALAVMLVALSCGVIAAKRGTRWWLVVPVLATLWIGVVLLQIVVGE